MRVLNETRIQKHKLTSTQVIALGFLGAILVGTLLLLIPVATAKGQQTDFVTALFTATTSICVTGLVVVDTFSHWSFWGQLIILFLIQIGGFGVITLYSLVMMAMKKKLRPQWKLCAKRNAR